jgi:hypothetical protein
MARLKPQPFMIFLGMVMVVKMMSRMIMCLAGIMSPGSDWSKRDTDHEGKSGNNLLQRKALLMIIYNNDVGIQSTCVIAL